MLHIGGHGAAGIKDLGPPGTGPQEAEGPLGIREPTDGVDEGTGLGNAASQEKLAPIEAGGAIPAAPGNAVGSEGLRRGASRDDPSLCG